MPNLAQIEIGTELASIASRLGRGAGAEALAAEALGLLSRAGRAEVAGPVIGRLLGTEARLGATFSGRQAVAGLEAAESALYGSGESVYTMRGGGLARITPTPSGQALRVERIGAGASELRPSYLHGTAIVDDFGILTGEPGNLRLVGNATAEMRIGQGGTALGQTAEGGLHLPVQVRTTPTSREFLIGGQTGAGQLGTPLNNFSPSNEVLDSIGRTQKIDGAHLHFTYGRVAEHYGPVSTPLGREGGRLISFDQRTGEALVTFDRGFSIQPGTEVVAGNALEEGRYHFGLHGTSQSIVRDGLGRLFGVETAYTPQYGFRLHPVQNVWAFSPSELTLPGNTTLARALNLSETPVAGARAAGGYNTALGGGVRIGF